MLPWHPVLTEHLAAHEDPCVDGSGSLAAVSALLLPVTWPKHLWMLGSLAHLQADLEWRHLPLYHLHAQLIAKSRWGHSTGVCLCGPLRAYHCQNVALASEILDMALKCLRSAGPAWATPALAVLSSTWYCTSYHSYILHLQDDKQVINKEE